MRPWSMDHKLGPLWTTSTLSSHFGSWCTGRTKRCSSSSSSFLSYGGALAYGELPVPTLQRLGGAARGFAASWGREELNNGLKVAA
jgi:hypothetical protein